MGINSEKEIEANLQIGPTSDGMVRLFIDAGTAEIPVSYTHLTLSTIYSV